MFNNLLLTNYREWYMNWKCSLSGIDTVTIQVAGWFELENLLSQRTLYSKLDLWFRIWNFRVAVAISVFRGELYWNLKPADRVFMIAKKSRRKFGSSNYIFNDVLVLLHNFLSSFPWLYLGSIFFKSYSFFFLNVIIFSILFWTIQALWFKIKSDVNNILQNKS